MGCAMKPGFDVCLHNKRLHLQIDPHTQKRVDHADPEQPPPQSYMNRIMNDCNKIYKAPTQFAVTTWSAYMIFAVILVHVGLLLWTLPPIKLGSAARTSVIILTPCILVRDLNILTRLHVLFAHGAGISALVFHPSQDESLSISFYTAAVFIAMTLILCKPRTGEPKNPTTQESSVSPNAHLIRDCIDVLSILALALQFVLKFTNMVSEFALDMGLITTIVLFYISKSIPL